jgi:hypothetical protein
MVLLYVNQPDPQLQRCEGQRISPFCIRVVPKYVYMYTFKLFQVLIVTSLKELSWVSSSDHYAFFPRCFLLNEDEKDELIGNANMTRIQTSSKYCNVHSMQTTTD